MFRCEICNYTTKRKYDLDKHFLTKKHIRNFTRENPIHDTDPEREQYQNSPKMPQNGPNLPRNGPDLPRNGPEIPRKKSKNRRKIKKKEKILIQGVNSFLNNFQHIIW